MDPVNTLKSAVEVTIKVKQYLESVKNASEEQKKIQDEIGTALQFLLKLQDKANDKDWGETLTSLAVPSGPLQRFKSELEKIAKKLPLGAGTFSKAEKTLTWHFKKDDIDKILLSIERQKGYFQLALQTDHIKLSKKIESDVEELKKQLSERQLAQESAEIVNWLSPFNFWQNQNDNFAAHQEGTGEWLIQGSPEFNEWLNGTNRILWCSGNPGVGKTILASIIIDHLEQSFPDVDDIGIAFIYFNYKEESTQRRTIDLFGSLLKQLVIRRKIVSDTVRELQKEHAKKKTSPILSELSKVLKAEMADFSKLFIVLDALDECNSDTRPELLSELASLGPQLHLLVTSRPNIGTVMQIFPKSIRLEIRASEKDMEKYLEKRIRMNENLREQVKGKFRKEITKAIIEKAKGMFLMAKLHIDSLSRLSNRKDIREALKRMPDELPATYDALMTRILSQDKAHVDLAMTVLMWITHAKEPLSPQELQHAVAFPPDSTELDEEALPSVRHLISLCAGIVVVDPERNVIRLVHYTTEHYFQDVRKKYFPDADAIIARTCLNYFCLVQDFREKNERDGGILSDDKEDHEDDPSSDSEAGEDEQNSSGSDDTVTSLEIELQPAPLLFYAIIHWGAHARRQEEMVKESILTFLGQESRLRFVRSELEAYSSFNFLEEFHVGSPKKLHTAAIFGLTKTVSCLLATGSDLSMGEGIGFTSLWWATLFCHESTVRLLLEKGANVNAKIGANGGTTLHVAAVQGHEEIVSLLLKSGADVNAELTLEDDSHTALDMARDTRHEAIVRVLLENKANSRNNAGSSVFWEAIYSIGLVRRMLE